MTTYIWYSSATDITGRTLAERLNATGVREKPANIAAGDIVIGWGAKTSRDVNLPHGEMLNHPNAIRANRNKFKSLELMSGDRSLNGNIAKFCKSDQVNSKIRAGEMIYPLIGRKNYHQGGSGFWLCPAEGHIADAINEGAQYFQSFIDIKDEFRLHVFGGKVIYAVKKVKNDTEAGWSNQRKEKINDYAQKSNINVDAATIDYALSVLYKEQQLPDRIVRSNHRGWKFSSVSVATLSAAMKNAAIKAVSVAGLDFGAVDCCIDQNSHPYIIEINSGPGLQETTLEKYVTTLQAKINEIVDGRRPAPAARRNNRGGDVRRGAAVAAVGAEAADNNNAGINGDQLRMLMNEVRSPEEARRVLDIAMGHV